MSHPLALVLGLIVLVVIISFASFALAMIFAPRWDWLRRRQAVYERRRRNRS